MSRALLLTGGLDHAHDFGASSVALVDVLAQVGVDTDVVDHPDDVPARLADVDLFVVNALRWRMEHERYAQWRERFAYTTSPALRDAITSFVATGGGLLGSHTAPICFDDWTEWGDVLGGSWVWETSSHPPFGPVEAHVVPDAAGHPVVAGVAPTLMLDDEVYGDMELRPDIEVLMVAKRTVHDVDQPVLWAHRYGRGRVVYDGFGHDAASIRNVHHATLLQRAARWLTEDR